VRGIDLDVGAVGDAGGGLVGADHRCEAELARDDGGVAECSAFFDDEGADDGKQRVHRRSCERRDEHVAGLELVECEHQVAHHARSAGVGGVADADPADGGSIVVGGWWWWWWRDVGAEVGHDRCGGASERLREHIEWGSRLGLAEHSRWGCGFDAVAFDGTFGELVGRRSVCSWRRTTSQDAVELAGEQLDDVCDLVEAAGCV
jgi:hypothetical protein